MREFFGAGRPSSDAASTTSHPSSVELDAGGTNIACERSALRLKGSVAAMLLSASRIIATVTSGDLVMLGEIRTWTTFASAIVVLPGRGATRYYGPSFGAAS